MTDFTNQSFSRKAKLLAELEISSSPAQVEDRMRKMIAFRQKMFTDAETNIKDAQASTRRIMTRKGVTMRYVCNIRLILFTFMYNSSIITFVVLLQEFGAGTLVLLRNSKRDSKVIKCNRNGLVQGS